MRSPRCPSMLRKIASEYWTDVAEYFREPRQGGALHPAFFIVLAVVFSAARRKIAVWEKSGSRYIVGDLGLRATLRSSVGHHSGFR